MFWLIVLFALPLLARGGMADSDWTRYDHIIRKHGEKYRISPLLIKAVIWRESCFRAGSVGKAGEIGLMQISLDAAREWARSRNRELPSKSQLFEPELNIEIGTWYLARARDYWRGHNRNFHLLALCEYNAGRTGMRRKVRTVRGGKIGISDSALLAYVNTIVQRYNYYLCKANMDH